ncbi:reverse transcriptase domain-containing protein [Tanacetum coccineum]
MYFRGRRRDVPRLQGRTKVEWKAGKLEQLIAELPTLTAPKEKEELIVYLAAAKETLNVKDDDPNTAMEVEEELPEPWILFTDGSSCADGSGAGLILINPEGAEFTYALRFRFEATNNEAEYEALIAGLRIAGKIEETLLAKVNKVRAMQRTRSVVAKALRTGYYWPTIHKDARALIRACQDCQFHKPIPRNLQQKLTPITSLWPFYKWGIDIAEPFSEGPGKVKFLIVAIDYFTKWIEAKPVATITGNQVKNFIWDNIVCRFGLPGEIISDNRKQF